MMEKWGNGVLGIAIRHHSITPSLHRPIPPQPQAL
jgi:hypothetical protein